MPATTLCFPVRDNQILLGMKLRGTGAGKFNGFGGKIEAGEAVVSAVVRELHEECGLIARPHALIHAAELSFFTGRELETVTHTFLVREWQGLPTASAEMQPRWFPIDQIPYDQMWADDRFWLPRILAGQRLRATFMFSAETQLLSQTISLL